MLITVAVLDGPAELPTSSSFTLTGAGVVGGRASPASSFFVLFPACSDD
jgi:hypothetical protein